jgi:hypothetical protein
MAFEVRDNTGTLGINNRKETEKHPDYSGSVRIEGKDYWISGWKKIKQADGSSFLSLAFKPKDGTSARPGQSEAKAVKDAFGLDEVPKATVRGGGFADLSDEVPFNKEWRA